MVSLRLPQAAFEILSELPTPEPAPPIPPRGKTKRLGIGIANLKSKPKATATPIFDGIRAALPAFLELEESRPALKAENSALPVRSPLPAMPVPREFIGSVPQRGALALAFRLPDFATPEFAGGALRAAGALKVNAPQPAPPGPTALQGPAPLAAAAPQPLLPVTAADIGPITATLAAPPREIAAAPLPQATAPNSPRIAVALEAAEVTPALHLPALATPESAPAGLLTTSSLPVKAPAPAATAPDRFRIAASLESLAEFTPAFRLPALDTPDSVCAALQASDSLPVNAPRPAQASPRQSQVSPPLAAAIARPLLPAAPADFQPELPASLVPPPLEIPTTLLPVAREHSDSRVVASPASHTEFAPPLLLPALATPEFTGAAIAATGSLATKLPQARVCAISGSAGMEPIPPSRRDAVIPAELPPHSRSALMLRPGATRVIALPPNPGSLDAAACIAQALVQKPASPRNPNLAVATGKPTLSEAAGALPLPDALAPAPPARLEPGAPAAASKPAIAPPDLPVTPLAGRRSLASGAPAAIAPQSTAGKAAIVRDAQPIASPAAGVSPAALRAIAAAFPLAPVPSDAVLAGDLCDFTSDPPPVADFVPVDYHCHRTVSKVHAPVEWLWHPTTQNLPRPPFHAVLGTLTALLPAGNTTYFATQSKRPRNWRPLEMAAAIGAIAVFLGAGMTVVGNFIKDAPDLRREIASSSGPSSSGPAWTRPEANSLNPVTAIRRVIANRAAVELGDTFQAGMEAWGHVKSLAPGWTRNSAGWVEPGQLAFFRPSMKFTDYRMEFYGQIESRSMDWVVRGKDPKNYYAMKFSYIEQGLRPVIAMVHYPVINGKAGRRSTTPLGIMVHNHEAYHVDVAVRGNHIVTSIEGQEVDRWIEDALPAGGVGFFADAGEKARIYWMKVAKNEDFLGKICALIGGNSTASRDTAFLFSPQAFYQGIYPNYGTEFFTATGYGN